MMLFTVCLTLLTSLGANAAGWSIDSWAPDLFLPPFDSFDLFDPYVLTPEEYQFIDFLDMQGLPLCLSPIIFNTPPHPHA